MTVVVPAGVSTLLTGDPVIDMAIGFVSMLLIFCAVFFWR